VAGGVLEGACPGHNTVYHSRSFVRVDFVALFGLRNFLPDQAFPDHIEIEAEGHAGRTQRVPRRPSECVQPVRVVRGQSW
jgi:hypothetical protein